MPSDRPLNARELKALRQTPPKGLMRPPYKEVEPNPRPTPEKRSTVSLRSLMHTLCDMLSVGPEIVVYAAGYIVGNLVKAARLGYHDGRGR